MCYPNTNIKRKYVIYLPPNSKIVALPSIPGSRLNKLHFLYILQEVAKNKKKLYISLYKCIC